MSLVKCTLIKFKAGGLYLWISFILLMKRISACFYFFLFRPGWSSNAEADIRSAAGWVWGGVCVWERDWEHGQGRETPVEKTALYVCVYIIYWITIIWEFHILKACRVLNISAISSSFFLLFFSQNKLRFFILFIKFFFKAFYFCFE